MCYEMGELNSKKHLRVKKQFGRIGFWISKKRLICFHLKSLTEVGHGICWQPRSSGHEDHEQDFVLFTHLLQDVPQPDHCHVTRIQVPENENDLKLVITWVINLKYFNCCKHVCLCISTHLENFVQINSLRSTSKKTKIVNIWEICIVNIWGRKGRKLK